MNLFIDTPQRAAVRRERERQAHPPASAQEEKREDLPPRRGAGLFATDDEGASQPVREPPSEERPAARADAGAPSEPVTAPARGAVQGAEEGDGYSAAEEAYREEKAFDRRRVRRSKLAHALRIVATLILVPLALAAVFLVSYALTCILNGASPDELATLVSNLLARIATAAREAAAWLFAGGEG